MPRHIALLRGINLASRRRVPMGDLRGLLAGFGYEDVRTLLQSGNVVLSSDETPETVQRRLEAEISQAFGFAVDVVVRGRDELAEVVARDPFGEVASDPKRYQVTFLSAEPAAEVARELAAADIAPERVVLSGREIYAWHADGIQRSPLAKLLTDEKLGVTATARNWNTVTKLLELAGE